MLGLHEAVRLLLHLPAQRRARVLAELDLPAGHLPAATRDTHEQDAAVGGGHETRHREHVPWMLATSR